MKVLQIILGIVAVFFLQNCNSGPAKPSKDIEGEYIFKYPSGQVEVLSVQYQPHTYSQFFYSNEKDYLNKATPLYKNDNTWLASGAELEFNNWLSICYLGIHPDSILVSPFHTALNNVNWYKATGNKKAEIDVFSANDYILKKKD